MGRTKQIAYDELKRIAARSGDPDAIDNLVEVAELGIIMGKWPSLRDPQVIAALKAKGYLHLENAQFRIRNFEGNPFLFHKFAVTFSALNDNFKLRYPLEPLDPEQGLYKLSDAWLYNTGAIMVKGETAYGGLRLVGKWMGPVKGSTQYQTCGESKSKLASFEIQENARYREEHGSYGRGRHEDSENTYEVEGQLGSENIGKVGGGVSHTSKSGTTETHEGGWRESVNAPTGILTFRKVNGLICILKEDQSPAAAPEP